MKRTTKYVAFDVHQATTVARAGAALEAIQRVGHGAALRIAAPPRCARAGLAG